MGEFRGFTCDGGCGAQIVLEHAAASLSEQGWSVNYRARGKRTLHAHSDECMIRALQGSGDELPSPWPGSPPQPAQPTMDLIERER